MHYNLTTIICGRTIPVMLSQETHKSYSSISHFHDANSTHHLWPKGQNDIPILAERISSTVVPKDIKIFRKNKISTKRIKTYLGTRMPKKKKVTTWKKTPQYANGSVKRIRLLCTNQKSQLTGQIYKPCYDKALPGPFLTGGRYLDCCFKVLLVYFCSS